MRIPKELPIYNNHYLYNILFNYFILCIIVIKDYLSIYLSIYLSTDENSMTMLLLLDLSAAFNMVDFNIILSRLRNCGIKDNCLSWFQDYLTGRSQVVCVQNVKQFVFKRNKMFKKLIVKNGYYIFSDLCKLKMSRKGILVVYILI